MGLFGKSESIDLTIGKMTCGNCVRHVTEALQGVSGVKRANVDLDGAAASVTMKPGTDHRTLIAAVEAAGYEASLREG